VFHSFQPLSLPEAPRLATSRARNPGRVKTSDLGLGTIDFKSMVGLEEHKPSIYNNSESRMLENTTRVRRLVEQLEAKEAEKNETQ